MKALHGTAIYTGGGIYVLIGELDNGQFFFGDNWCCDIFDADTREIGEDDFLNCCYPEWQEQHIVESDTAEVLAMYKDFYTRLANGEPDITDGYEDYNNYIASEILQVMDIEEE